MPPYANKAILERETGFEPATSTLARLHSTTELLPHGRRRFLYGFARSVKKKYEFFLFSSFFIPYLHKHSFFIFLFTKRLLYFSASFLSDTASFSAEEASLA